MLKMLFTVLVLPLMFSCATTEVDIQRDKAEESIHSQFDAEKITPEQKFVFQEVEEEYPGDSFFVNSCGLPDNQKLWSKSAVTKCKSRRDDFYFKRLLYTYRRANVREAFSAYFSHNSQDLGLLETLLRKSHNDGVEVKRESKLKMLKRVYSEEYHLAKARDNGAWAAFAQGMNEAARGMNQAYSNNNEPQVQSAPYPNLYHNVAPNYSAHRENPLGNNVCNCKGYAGVGGPCYAGVGGPAYDGVGGPAYAGVGGPCYAGVGGPAYDGVGGPAYKGVGGPKYDGVGGPAYDGVGGPAYAGVGGPCYAGVGGPCYAGVGGGGNCPSVCK